MLVQILQSSEKRLYDVKKSALGCFGSDLKIKAYVFVKMISLHVENLMRGEDLNAQDVQKSVYILL